MAAIESLEEIRSDNSVEVSISAEQEAVLNEAITRNVGGSACANCMGNCAHCPFGNGYEINLDEEPAPNKSEDILAIENQDEEAVDEAVFEIVEPLSRVETEINKEVLCQPSYKELLADDAVPIVVARPQIIEKTNNSNVIETVSIERNSDSKQTTEEPNVEMAEHIIGGADKMSEVTLQPEIIIEALQETTDYPTTERAIEADIEVITRSNKQEIALIEDIAIKVSHEIEPTDSEEQAEEVFEAEFIETSEIIEEVREVESAINLIDLENQEDAPIGEVGSIESENNIVEINSNVEAELDEPKSETKIDIAEDFFEEAEAKNQFEIEQPIFNDIDEEARPKTIKKSHRKKKSPNTKNEEDDDSTKPNLQVVLSSSVQSIDYRKTALDLGLTAIQVCANPNYCAAIVTR